MNFDTQTPHIEPIWSDAFLLELRIRGVDGRQIGAALAEVEAHCAESGESADAAFGDPTAYAAALAPQSVDTFHRGREFGTSGLGLVGMLLTQAGVASWRSGSSVEVTVGLALLVVLTVATCGVAIWQAERLLRLVTSSRWAVPLIMLTLIGLAAGVMLIGRPLLFSFAAPVAVLIGCGLLAANLVLALRQAAPSDPIVGPDEAAGAGTMSHQRTAGALARLTPWLFPLITAVLVLPILIFG